MMQRRDFLRFATKTAAGLYLTPLLVEPVRRFWPGADFGYARVERFDRDLLFQSCVDVERWIRDDLAATHRLAIDAVAHHWISL